MEDVPLEFRKQERFSYYVVGEDSLSAVRIREDLELRSAFFSVFEEADSIVIMGRGYGHGVGLCQEGAMSMARKGHTYRDILDFYLSGIRISASTDFEK
jgi:stage II sporulation protein D